MQLVQSTGRRTVEFFQTFKEIVYLFYDIVTRLLFNKTTRINRSQVVNQVLFIGLDAVLLTVILGLGFGITVTTQLVDNGANIKATSYFGTLMVLIVKELSPLITAIVVIGRSGSAFTTFLGNMQVTRETDALKSMGIPVIDYLCIPSFLGMLISLTCLNFYFSMAAVTGGIFIAMQASQVPFSILSSQIFNEFGEFDPFYILFKCIIFGSVISSISSFYGLAVRSIRIVPRAVFRTVVGSIITILAANILTMMAYFFFQKVLIYVSR